MGAEQGVGQTVVDARVQVVAPGSNMAVVVADTSMGRTELVAVLKLGEGEGEGAEKAVFADTKGYSPDYSVWVLEQVPAVVDVDIHSDLGSDTQHPAEIQYNSGDDLIEADIHEEESEYVEEVKVIDQVQDN